MSINLPVLLTFQRLLRVRRQSSSSKSVLPHFERRLQKEPPTHVKGGRKNRSRVRCFTKMTVSQPHLNSLHTQHKATDFDAQSSVELYAKQPESPFYAVVFDDVKAREW